MMLGQTQADALAPFYSTWLEGCTQWAALADQRSADSLAAALPPIASSASAPLDITALAVVVASRCDLGDAKKLGFFRSEVGAVLAMLPASPLHHATAPWATKGALHLFCEIFLLLDLSSLQLEAKAVAIMSVVAFGRDAASAESARRPLQRRLIADA